MLTDSVDKISPAFFGFMLLFGLLHYISKEFNCNILQLDNVSYRLFISNILNCEQFRESEIAKVDYFGWYQLGRKTKGLEEEMGIFTLLAHCRCMFSTSVPKEKIGWWSLC